MFILPFITLTKKGPRGPFLVLENFRFKRFYLARIYKCPSQNRSPFIRDLCEF